MVEQATAAEAIDGRPFPPDDLAHSEFRPAPAVGAWVLQHLSARGALHNPDHEHLASAHVGWLWAGMPCERRGRTVVGTAECPSSPGTTWGSRARGHWQLLSWFGYPAPDFLITLDAEYCRTATPASWCALVEHELYHCAQATDEYGTPRYNRDGHPVWTIRGHDVEEFVGVVARYGAGPAAGQTEALVRAAQGEPAVAARDVALACGVCIRQAA